MNSLLNRLLLFKLTHARDALHDLSDAEALILAQRTTLRDHHGVTCDEILVLTDISEELFASRKPLLVERMENRSVHGHRDGACHFRRSDLAFLRSHG